MVEQGIENPRVGGSIPSLGTEPKGLETFGFETQASVASNERKGEAGPKRAPLDVGEPNAGEGAPLSAPLVGRSGVMVRLAGELGALVTAGDLEGARAVHETIGRLLAPVRPVERPGAVVVDLEAERERRAGR